MKTCSKCEISQELSNFRARNRAKDKKSSWCKKCTDIHKKNWYIKNKEKYRELALIWAKKRKREIEKFLIEYLKKHPCVDCQEKDIRVLDFDHNDKDLKIKSISNMYSSSIETVKEEIQKCTIRCANCHRIRTVKQFNWYKNQL